MKNAWQLFVLDVLKCISREQCFKTKPFINEHKMERTQQVHEILIRQQEIEILLTVF